MSASIYKITATATTGAIAATGTVPASEHYRLAHVTIHFNTAPATAGSLTVTLNANSGAAYDTLLATQSMIGVTNYVYFPDRDFFLQGGDAIDVAYANADNRTYGVEITFARV